MPLGVASLVHEVEPLYASSKLPLEETAENVEAATPLPQVSDPLETPQLPLEVDIVKLEALPEMVYVAAVCVDHVPAVSKLPVVLAWRCALLGRPVEVGVDPEVVGVPLPLLEPVLSGYLSPVDAQDPFFGASIATKSPSISEPFRLK